MIFKSKMSQPQVPFETDRIYHAYNHVIGNIDLFVEDRDYRFFLNKFIKYFEDIVTIYAYCLMPNHYHFLLKIDIEIDQSSSKRNPVSQAFSNFQNSYARHYNIKYKRKGGLFQSRIQRKLISSQQYLLEVVKYIHQNPVDQNFVGKCEEWEYSSYSAIISQSSKTKIDKQAVIDWFDGVKNFIYCHKMAGG